MDTARLELLLDRYFDSGLQADEQRELEIILLSSSRARELYWSRASFHALLRRYAEEAWGADDLQTDKLKLTDSDSPNIIIAATSQLTNAYPVDSPAASNSTSTASLPASCVTETADPIASLDQSPLIPTRPLLGQPIWFLTSALVLIFCVVITMQVSGRLITTDHAGAVQTDTANSDGFSELLSDVVGILAQSLDADWNPEYLMPRRGELLAPGRLQLTSGTALIEFSSGASVMLQGPVDFEIQSRDRAYCYSGKLSAYVPNAAAGFRIDTPSCEVLDRGTAFGIVVDGLNATEVHTLEGLVEVTSRDNPSPQEVQAGIAIRTGADHLTEFEADPTRFMSAADFSDQLMTSSTVRIAAWQVHRETILSDPSLVAYYDFEPDSSQSRRLKNRVVGAGNDSDGTIVGCEWTDGRWPGKRALDFKRPVDRVRLHVPGEFHSLTLMAWARVDSTPNDHNSIFQSDGWDPGNIHWNISRRGGMQVNLAQVAYSPVLKEMRGIASSKAFDVLKPENFGQWMQLAVVFDGNTKQLSHWQNGQMLTSSELASETNIHIGSAELGNWQPRPAALYPIRNFNGRLDEFLFFRRALSADEIAAYHNLGRPLVTSNTP